MTHPYPAAGATASRLVLHPNRHMTAVLDDGSAYALRPPSLDEWREILNAYLEAERLMEAPISEDDRGTLQRQYGVESESGAPYAEAFALVLKLCSGNDVSPNRLPVWAGSATLFQKFYDHWRGVEIVVEDAQPEPVTTPPTGYGAVSSQATELPVGPEADVVVFDPDAPIVEELQPQPVAAGFGPRTAPGEARIAT